ncbi:MAG: D-alanyl-D-alanine carboxypeptidase [Clostridia bacterium]|nr:D-alanyl-D-alanine carboxypeptidase [Clostridia bacterium]NLS84574.1 D-alanyl-D-alanine carboxypeptidase [Oscillospiraceae bacterium]
MKKCASVILALFCFFMIFMPLSFAEGFTLPDSVSVTAASAYFVNLDTGIVVYEKNSNEKRSIASLTKLMTALLLIENVQDLDGTEITAATKLYVEPITNYDSSTADIRPGETVTARTLLYAMLLPSANEAAQIAANYLGNDNLENFYAMMNARAVELGCKNTNFMCAHGLYDMEDGNYSTAYDLSLIARACWQYDVFREVVGSTSYDMPFTNVHTTPEYASNPNAAYTIQTSVKMQVPSASVYRDYIHGIKTGSTLSAGRNFVSAATNSNGESFIGVVLGCPWDPAEDGYAYSFHDTANVYDWMFANFSVKPTLDTTSPITEVKVTLSSETDSLMLYPASNLSTYMPTSGGEGTIETTFDVPESVKAPVAKGDVMGTATVSVNGVTIGTVDLVSGQDISRNSLLYIFDRTNAFFGTTFFKVLVIVTVIYCTGFFALWLYVQNENKKRREAKRKREAQMRQRQNRD